MLTLLLALAQATTAQVDKCNGVADKPFCVTYSPSDCDENSVLLEQCQLMCGICDFSAAPSIRNTNGSVNIWVAPGKTVTFGNGLSSEVDPFALRDELQSQGSKFAEQGSKIAEQGSEIAEQSAELDELRNIVSAQNATIHSLHEAQASTMQALHQTVQAMVQDAVNSLTHTPTTTTSRSPTTSPMTSAPSAAPTTTPVVSVWRSNQNGAQVMSYLYSGSNTRLTWDVTHAVCAAAGAKTPGSSANYKNKYCSYSPQDNHVVTSGCNWGSQRFTYVRGSLNNRPGYMCAHSNCDHGVILQGSSSGGWSGSRKTIRTGDYVMCSVT